MVYLFKVFNKDTSIDLDLLSSLLTFKRYLPSGKNVKIWEPIKGPQEKKKKKKKENNLFRQ